MDIHMDIHSKKLVQWLVSGCLAFFLAGAVSAQTTLTLPENWQFSPDGGIGNAGFVEKLILTGWSHVDNDFAAGTFIEQGILQVSSYIDPVSGLSRPISDLTTKDVYLSWEGLTGTQVNTGGGNVAIDFTNGGIIRLYVDDTPAGTLKINDNGVLGTNDADSFTHLADGLTPIATLAVIDSTLNTDTNTTEFTGGSFDLNVSGSGGVGQFVIWSEMDVAPGHFFDGPGNDLEAIDSEIAADGTVTSSGTLEMRVSVDAQQDPFTFKDPTSTSPPGAEDDGDASQEDNYEAAIAAIHGVAVPDLRQTITGGIFEDIFVFHRGDGDIQAPELLTASLGDRVWEDQNNNGIQDCDDTNGNNIIGDAGDTNLNGTTECDAGIQNVEVWLGQPLGGICDLSDGLGMEWTDLDGFYLFDNLVPGDYCVVFTKPTESTHPELCESIFGSLGDPEFTTQNAEGLPQTPTDSDADQGTGETGPVTLGPGDTNLTLDAGIVCPAKIGDRVWVDLNGDGIQQCEDTDGDGMIGGPGDTGDECDRETRRRCDPVRVRCRRQPRWRRRHLDWQPHHG